MEFRFLCFECPARICSCWGSCKHKPETHKDRFEKCPHKQNSLYKEKNGSLTTSKDCFSCGAHFDKM